MVGACVPVHTAVAQPLNNEAASQGIEQVISAAALSTQSAGQAASIVVAAAQAAQPTTGEKVIQVAEGYIGTPYVYGGSTPSGFDCSGFTMYCYSQLGISLARTAQAQYNNAEKVAQEDLQVGDLVFFGTSGSSVYHVGMYVGDDQYIHSPQTGDSVKIASLSSAYNYLGGGRVA